MSAPSAELHLTAGSTGDGVWDVVVTPAVAGWGWTSLRAADLGPGQEVGLETGEDEVVLVPLRGGLLVRVDGEGEPVGLVGRDSVWAGPTDVLYLPAGTSAVLSATGPGGARVGVPGARTGLLGEGERKPVRRIDAADVAVELRGAGACTREVRNFAAADVDVATRLVAVEVVTPAGNWSSYPPHKHDEASAVESELEEVYYYEVAPGPDGQPGVGYHRTYGTPDRPLDVLAEVRDRDTVLVPHGWHGPCMAAPGHHLYYLNAMAGPADDRAWRIVDDPDHAWVRATWADQPTDPRLPLGTTAAEDPA
ncbi:5-deoxy-glucuronate isomerase [Pseudokineococcus basanitobsidens]|uniref:5-deoxy-glucuronate isomerase n=1 Tax=Pseudokineococcus basanitobsidens TaxID=1926649 RepID=A0ABU8RFW4_9ACTN